VRNYPSGKPHVEEHYQDGQRHGKLTEWNEEGQAVQEMEFKAGKLDGRLVIRAPGGTEIIQNYRDGQLVPERPEAGAP
jgi:antitoxin component YwqK of YwqJK toxin-antitoxin module